MAGGFFSRIVKQLGKIFGEEPKATPPHPPPSEPPKTPPRGPGQRPTFQSVKSRMKAKKHYTYRDTIGYNPYVSGRQVDRSDAYDEMEEALQFSEDQMDEYASKASIAWRFLNETGDAGELADYLNYDFLWYH